MTQRNSLLSSSAFAGLLVLTLAFAGCTDDKTGGDATGTSAADTTVADTTDTAATETDPADTAVTDTDGPVETGELAITEIIPGKGRATGLEQVELIGTGFRAGQQLFFGESLAQDTFVLNERRIVALTPPRSPGLVDVRIIDPDTGASSVYEDGYLFFNPVEIIEIDPPTGHLLGGDPVTIVGTGFLPGSRVIFGQRSAVSVEVQNDGSILAVVPEGDKVGPVNVHVTNALGIGSLGDGFLYVDQPMINTVTPPVGTVAGGTAIELKGTGFYEPVTVVIGSRPLLDIVLIDAQTVRGTVPAGEAGPVDVLLSTPYGTGAVSNGFTYLADVNPGAQVELLALSPPHGPALGGTRVTIVAKGLTTGPDTTVMFGGVEASVIAVAAAGHTVIVESPASAGGAIGPVDVILTNSNGSATLTDGFAYEAFVRVYEVSPNFGPTEGGTAVTISGVGFAEGAQVRIGALPASGVRVINDKSITAIVPPGSPGLANVTVTQSGLSDTLVGGFAYQAPLSLWVVDPALGAQAGGTQVALIGSGFPSDARVKFGDGNATHVNVASSTVIYVKTPPGRLGTVSVEVISASKGSVLLADAFTYYDPESIYGGTWGEDIEGAANVTVLDSSNGAPIADAFVMLWTDPETPYQGFTNADGQVTFSGDDLEGEQMVSASKTGYTASSVVEYDAVNVTLYLNPTAPPSPGTPPSAEPAFYTGTIRSLGKAVPLPPATCASKPNAPAPECDICDIDSDCGVGYRCSALGNEGLRCTKRCNDSIECATGFGCFPVNGSDDNQCIPIAGELTAFCDFSNSSIFGQDLLPNPGIEANSDRTFTIPVPFGEFAVFCYAGVIDRSTQEFTPYALGLDRHVFALPGDALEGEIIMAHPMVSTYTVQLDDVPRGPEGPDFNVLFRYLDLGSDGVIEFLGQVDSFGTQPFVLENFLSELTGDLYDASFAFMGGSFAITQNFIPYSLTLHQNIERLVDDTMYYLEDGTWTPRRTGVTRNINDLFTVGEGDVVGVGTQGQIIRSLGTSWAVQSSGVDTTLNGVHGNDATLVAVGEDGTILAYNGLTWGRVDSPTSSDLTDVWMDKNGTGFAVGFYTVNQFDGATWTSMFGNTTRNLNGVFGFAPDDVWAVGSFGQIIRYDGVTWETQAAGTNQALRDVWGTATDDVFIVGEGGTILHWDGLELLAMTVDTTQTFTAVWGTGPDNVYAVGSRGTFFHYDGATWNRVRLGGNSGDANLLAVGGESTRPVITGAHELLLGPILAVPENVSPTNGGVMQEEYRISWDVQPGTDPHFSYVEVAIPGLTGPVPEWQVTNDWDVTDILLPDFPNIEGTPGISPGTKILTIFRVYKEGFDIDNYSNQDLNQFFWRSWAINQVVFTKL